MIKINDKIPSFSLNDENGNSVTSESLAGIKYILFFYPQDDSPSCTKEACSVRDYYSSIQKAGYKIFGVSPDNEKKHKKFIAKYEFQYPLLADTELALTKSLGLYGPKKFMGKDIIGVYRTTLFVNEKGIVTNIIDNVKTATHGEQIMDIIKNR